MPKIPGFLKKLACCCKKNDEKDEDVAPNNSQQTAASKQESGWEEGVLDEILLKEGPVQYAAIVTFPKGEVKAKNFDIEKKSISSIIEALEGDTAPIVEGIRLCESLPLYSPGKLEPGESIFGTAIAGEGEEPATGGCAIFKTKNHVLIAAFDKDLEGATNYTRKIADGMIENGH